MKELNLSMISIVGAPDYINNILNRSIRLVAKYNCSGVNGASIFLSVIESMDNIDKHLKKLDLELMDIKEEFEVLAKEGAFGEFGDLTGITNEDGEVDSRAFINDYTMSVMFSALTDDSDDLSVSILRILKDHPDEALNMLLDSIEIEMEKLIKIIVDSASSNIPNKLKPFLTDMHDVVAEKNDKIENVDVYVDKLINVLCRKTKKNPCLIGEAGVGKTSIVEALIKRMSDGDVPSYLSGKHVFSINSSVLMAGTRFRGDLEARLAALFDFASRSGVILFLDEIHVFMNLGKNSEESSQSVGNLIKEYLNDGRISIIGTTTNKEWHKFIEKDSALKRRLQEINVDEPSVELAIKMVANTLTNYTNFHGVKLTAGALTSAVRLSDKYMKSEKLPDKAYKVIDQACATAKIKNDKKLRITVTEEDIAKVISELTGIEVSRLMGDELTNLKHIGDNIKTRLIGQNQAVDTVVKAIKRGKVGIADPNRPVASFLFVGPTGVGKTELCKLVSEQIYANKESFIRIDMSEYSNEFANTKLIGSAPGYIGYGEGGALTEKVKRHPNSLILLDEIEKANPKIFDSFLQVLDDGRLTDAEGNTVDFTNCIIVMTSNAGYGAEAMGKKQIGLLANTYEVSPEEKEKIAIKELENTFRPEFLNRVDNIVIFNKLSKEDIKEITRLSLCKVHDRLSESRDINISFDESVVDYVSKNGYSDRYGARNINRFIRDNVESYLTDLIIEGDIKDYKSYNVKYEDNKFVTEEA